MNNMRNILSVFILSSIFISCSNELKKEEAIKLVSEYYHLPVQTEIAVDERYDDYGWPPEKYKKLEEQGLISQSVYINYFGKRYTISTTEKGQKFYTRTEKIFDPASGKDINQFYFIGYKVDIKELQISENSSNDITEAEVILKIYDISPFQEIFNPISSSEIKKKINFKFSDNTWKIVDGESSGNLVKKVDNPMHWVTN